MAMAFACTTGVSTASATPVTSLQTWKGYMPLGVQPLLQSSLATTDAFRNAWTTCGIKGTPPAVDFKKRIVVLAVRRGTTVSFNSMTLDAGNLTTNVVVTPDMPNHMTCALVLVDRSGVKTVNGAPIGK